MVACRRIESGLFKRAFLQTLLIKEEAVRVPTQKIHALPVPGEEHEDVPCHRGQGGGDSLWIRLNSASMPFRILTGCRHTKYL